MKSLIRPHFCLATLLLISTTLTGCGGQPQSNTAAARPPSGQTSASRLFGFTVQTMNNPFFIDLEQGLKSGIEAHGDRLVTLDAQLNETLRWTRSTLAPFALVRLYSLVPHLLPVVLIIPVVTIYARAFPVACLSRRSDHAILLACHGNLYHDSAPTALH